MKIHHIGFLCKNINISEKEFLKIGFTIDRPQVYDAIRDCIIEFVKKDGYSVELICPATKNSPFYPLLVKYKNTPYHFCYEVEDLDKATKNLTNDNFTVLQNKELAPALNNREVVFLYKNGIGIIELVNAVCVRGGEENDKLYKSKKEWE